MNELEIFEEFLYGMDCFYYVSNDWKTLRFNIERLIKVLPATLKTIGLENRYEVKKIANPTKKIDGIVLEFDDPLSRAAILQWANTMRSAGYRIVHMDVLRKLQICFVCEGAGSVYEMNFGGHKQVDCKRCGGTGKTRVV